MSLIKEINDASKKQLTENMSCENEEHTKKTKPKTPRVFATIKDKFKDVEPTLAKVKAAIKAEFKKEVFSTEKEEWEKMTKAEQNSFADAMFKKIIKK